MTDNAKIYLFCCLTNFEPADLAAQYGEDIGEIKIMPVPCAGKIDILYLIKAFETGAEGVAIVTCKDGDCRYLEGNLRARKRGEAVEYLTEEVGLGKGRVSVFQIDEEGVTGVARKLQQFSASVKELTRNNEAAGVRR